MDIFKSEFEEYDLKRAELGFWDDSKNIRFESLETLVALYSGCRKTKCILAGIIYTEIAW